MSSPEYAKVVPEPEQKAEENQEASAGEAVPLVADADSKAPLLPKRSPAEVVTRTLNSRPMRGMFQVCCGSVLWGLIVFFVFFFPQLTKYTYLSGTVNPITGKYKVKEKFMSPNAEITLVTGDKWDGGASTAEAAHTYPDMVNVPTDRDGDPGWYLQDIVDVERPPLLNPAGVHYKDGARMIEDVRFTTQVDCEGEGYDWATTGLGYTGCYRSREAFLSNLDGDWFQSNYHLMRDNTKNPLASFYGNYGVPNVNNPIGATGVTSGKFVCNLGRQRMPLGAIQLNTKGCHVQIAAREGDGYHVWVRRAFVQNSKFAVTNQIGANATTGCRSYDVSITVENPSCTRDMVPGMAKGCSEQCTVILFKGEKARRVPIVVNPDPAADSPSQALVVNDPSLVLDNGRAPAPWQPAGPPDLKVTAGNMDVSLSLARIKSVNINTLGTISVSNLRFDGGNFVPRNDLVIQDSRDFELRYRSAANFLCLASPVVEDIPEGFMPCIMKPADAAKHIHLFYDEVTDGFIDRTEFANGIARLGLDFEGDSLNLNDEQQGRLYDHVFQTNNPEAAKSALPYDLFQSQLDTLAPYFSTLYDTNERQTYGTPGTPEYFFACGAGASVTDASFGLCQPDNGCSPTCGNPDISIDGYSTDPGQINYQYYDVNPPDGVITYEEMRQALLKLYGNCTYVIEPGKGDYATCRYVGGGQFENMGFDPRRECQTYSDGRYDSNAEDWRFNNTGLPESWVGAYKTPYGATFTPRECRPFPDYNPDLNNKMYCGEEYGGPDPSCSEAEVQRQSSPTSCPECFMNSLTLTRGERVPPQYYNRSTWAAGNFQDVNSLLKDIFSEGNVGSSYFPYFNISDDDQYRLFASKLFSRTVVVERVSYDQFDSNMQTLNRVNGVGANYYLFNPGCYRGKFMKVKLGDWRGATAEQLSSAFIEYDPASPETVLNSNMPNYAKSFSPGQDTSKNPCPSSWNTQGATQQYNGYTSFVPTRTIGGKQVVWPQREVFPTENGEYFSTFSFPDVSTGRGYKWGRALPSRCLDEVWPNGGINGSYPNDPNVYGMFAGQPIQPGCELMACKPMAKSDVFQSSIHAQVLPFTFDPQNATGNYANMVSNCTRDNLQACFFRGYEFKDFNRFTRGAATILSDFQTTYVSRASPIASFIMYDVVGLGVPNFQKWFWSSMQTYLDMEPAWISAFSAGVLTPTLVNAKVRMSPGYCVAESGAVESWDWHSNATYDLRRARSQDIYNALVAATRPPTEANIRGGIELKQLWRSSLKNESLASSESSADGVLDTREDDGKFFFHNKVCVADERDKLIMLDTLGVVTSDILSVGDGSCASAVPSSRGEDVDCDMSVIMLDNCKVERHPVLYNCTNGFPLFRASACEYADGKSALNVVELGASSPPFNLSSFHAQTPRVASDYYWPETKKFDGDDVVLRNLLTGNLYERFLNSTHNIYTEFSVRIDGGSGEFVFANARNAWLNTITLALCVFLSLIIASMLGLVVAAILAYIGVLKLEEFNKLVAERTKLSDTLQEGKRTRVLNIMHNDKIRRTLVATGDAEGVELTADEVSRYRGFMKSQGWDINQLALEDWDVNTMVEKCRHIDELEKKAKTGFMARANSMAEHNAAALKAAQALHRRFLLLDNRIQKMKSSKSTVERAFGTVLVMFMLSLKAIAQAKNFIVKLLSLQYPSPFTVINLFIENQIRSRLVNSIKAFVNAKCVRDHVIAENEEIRCGGSMLDLKEFVPGKKVLRLGVDSPVGISKTLYGRYVHYKVKYVVISIVKQPYTLEDGTELMGNAVHVKEGPRTYNSTNVGKEQLDFEKSVGIKDVELGDTREFILNGVAPGQGDIYNMVIKAGYGTRTIQVETTGDSPEVHFKTIYRNFASGYEDFCLNNRLQKKDILKSEATLRRLKIDMAKRSTVLVKGIRMKTDADRMAERERAEAIKAWIENQQNKVAVVAPTSTMTEQERSDMLMQSALTEDKKITIAGSKKEFASGLKGALDNHADSVDAEGHAQQGAEEEQNDDELNVDSIVLTPLEMDDSPLAQFIRSQYCVSGQFSIDFEEKAVFDAKFRKWCVRQGLAYNEPDDSLMETFNIKVANTTFYDMFGVTVNERVGDVAKPSLLFTYALLALSCICHIFAIIIIPYPLMAVVFSQYFIYQKTSAIVPQFTFSKFREDPFMMYEMEYQPPENVLVLTICYIFIVYAAVKLFLFYVGYHFEKSMIRVMIKSVFYLMATFLLAMIASLVVLECVWMLLGAIIKPDEFLPYCSAVMTVVGTVQAQKKFVEDLFAKWQAILASAVAFAFAMKVRATCMALRVKMEMDPEDPKNKDTKKTWTAKDTVPPFEVFKLHAGDDDSMDFNEFSALLDRFDIEMIESRRRLIFNRADADGSGSIKYKELEEAWEYMQGEITEAELTNNGITRTKMLMIFVYAIVVLSLLLVFIFVGVAAFVLPGGSGFGAVVNSGLTGLSGAVISLGKKSGKDEDKKAAITSV